MKTQAELRKLQNDANMSMLRSITDLWKPIDIKSRARVSRFGPPLILTKKEDVEFKKLSRQLTEEAARTAGKALSQLKDLEIGSLQSMARRIYEGELARALVTSWLNKPAFQNLLMVLMPTEGNQMSQAQVARRMAEALDAY